MSVIQFPNHREKRELRNRQRWFKRRVIFGSVRTWIKQVSLGVSYGFRVILANTLHYTVVSFLNLLHFLKKPVFIVSALACLVNWLTFNQLMPSHNYLVPFFGVISLLAISGEMIATRIDAYEPFHRMMGCGEFRRKEIRIRYRTW